jgi:hypothetical protein
LALKQLCFSSKKYFKVGHEVSWEVASTEVALQLGENNSKGRRLNMLRGVNAETTETNADYVSQVGSNTLADVV